MPRVCSACTHPEVALLSKSIAAGGSNRDVAARFGVAISAVQRHRVNCLKQPRKAKESGDHRERSGIGPAGRFANDSAGRCPTCGVSASDEDPKTLIKRAERALHFGEQIVMRAVDEKNDRTALSGLDRVRSSLEMLMKVHGLLQADGASSTFIDARKQQVQILGKLTLEELRAIASGVPLAVLGDGRETAAIEGG